MIPPQMKNPAGKVPGSILHTDAKISVTLGVREVRPPTQKMVSPEGAFRRQPEFGAPGPMGAQGGAQGAPGGAQGAPPRGLGP